MRNILLIWILYPLHSVLHFVIGFEDFSEAEHRVLMKFSQNVFHIFKCDMGLQEHYNTTRQGFTEQVDLQKHSLGYLFLLGAPLLRVQMRLQFCAHEPHEDIA